MVGQPPESQREVRFLLQEPEARELEDRKNPQFGESPAQAVMTAT